MRRHKIKADFDFAIPKARLREDGSKIRPARRKIALGSPNRRITREKTVAGIEHSYHATKGWRSRRVPK